MQISKIVVTKGKTFKVKSKWKKVEFQLELLLNESDDIEQVKEFANMLVTSWLLKE